jgi:radical SAM protein with 4Fe4S-binding SPASM domain
VHCYIEATGEAQEGELTTVEAQAFIDDLADFKAPVILFSGGEPLMREDLFVLGRYAKDRGLRTVISTNGTLITKKMARKTREADFSYVGISLDGMESTNDEFRGVRGAFDAALRGIHNCKEAGIRTGLRFTVNRHNYKDLEDVLELIEKEEIPRVCFYHLVYAGRGTRMVDEDITNEQTRKAVDFIFDKTEEFHRKKLDIEILTVDNHTDGPYLYMRLKKRDPGRAAEVMQLLEWNGGNSSGIGIGCVDNLGNVHADQFWQHYSFGNVRKRKFSEIWTDTSDELMKGLKNRKLLLKGRCKATNCKFIDICNGNFRVRAEAIFGDVWAQEPACYLSDDEISRNCGPGGRL